MASRVHFGIFDWIDRSELSIADNYDMRLRMLEYADSAGFYCYHLAEHQGSPLGMAPSPGLFLSAAAQRTKNIRLGPLVYLLPIYNPLRLTQEICMLDHLCRGRLDLGVGRGISPIELSFYNVSNDQSRPMFQEALDIITKGLTTGMLDYEGEHFSFDGVQLHMEPYQRPYPPLWYPTDSVDRTEWLAREGFNTITHYPTMDKMRELFDLYRQVWEKHREDESRLNGHEPDPKYGIVRHVYVGETDAEAMREAKAAFTYFNDNFNYLRTSRGDSSRAEFLGDFEARMADGLHVVGSPESVAEQVRHHIDTTSTNYFVSSFFFGNLTEEQTLNSLKLFAERVLPEFRSAD